MAKKEIQRGGEGKIEEKLQLEEQGSNKNFNKYILNIVGKTLKRNTIEHLDYHITEHCNLNCVGCSAFAPLASPSFVKIESFERDIKNLYNIVGDVVQQIHLLGGEPLLHPEVEQFAKIGRSIFKNARIDITTNGLCVFDMSDMFWKVLRENDIAIKYTQYPLKFDYAKMIKYIKEKGVYVFSAGPKGGIKYFRRIPLNLKATFNIYQSFIQCPYTDCIQLRDGKLYHCPASAFSYLLNEKIKKEKQINEEFRISESDFIELNTDITKEDIFQFISNAVPFCQYCDLDNINERIEWKTSKRNLQEWIDL